MRKSLSGFDASYTMAKEARTKAKQKEWNGEARRTPIWGDPVAQDGENSQAQESLAMVVMAFS